MQSSAAREIFSRTSTLAGVQGYTNSELLGSLSHMHLEMTFPYSDSADHIYKLTMAKGALSKIFATVIITLSMSLKAVNYTTRGAIMTGRAISKISLDGPSRDQTSELIRPATLGGKERYSG